MAKGIAANRFQFKVNKLMVATTIAVILGITLGLSLRAANLTDDAIAWIRIWGELFIRMFSVVTLPIIIACIIKGITGLEGRTSCALILATALYMFYTTFFCVLFATVLHFIIRPGQRTDQSISATSHYDTEQSYADLCFDVLRNLVPDNLVSAAMETVYTATVREEIQGNSTNSSDVLYIEKKELRRRYGINSLGIVFVTIVFACAMRMKKEKARPLKDLCQSLAEVTFTVVDMVMWYSPIGVCCMIAGALLVEPDLLGALKVLLLFVVANVTAMVLHAFVLLPVTYLVIVRKNPLVFYTKIVDALSAGFAPPSNVVIMTVLLDKSEQRFETKSDVANFFLPIAVVLMKNGSTLFICSAVLFIAESQNVQLNVLSFLVIGCLVAILTAAVPNIPSGSLFIVILVSSVLQLPIQDTLGQLYTVEWLLDRLRVLNNGVGISFGVPIIDRLTQKFSTDNEKNNTIEHERDEQEKDTFLSNGYIINIGTKPSENGRDLKYKELSCEAEEIV